MLDPMVAGAELADWQAAFEVNGAAVDMTSGWTFQVTAAARNSTTALFTKTTNITGTTTGCTVSWATTGELNALTATASAGTVYDLQLRCRRTSDSRDLIQREQITIYPAHA